MLPWPTTTSTKTWARSFTISTLLDTTSSRTCHKVCWILTLCFYTYRCLSAGRFSASNKFVLLISPSGDHKKRAKYRFASKTLMRILPDNLKNEVEGLISQKNITLDLYEILGQCTWGQAKSL